MILLGLAMVAHHDRCTGSASACILGVLFIAAGVGRLYDAEEKRLVARKLPGLRRELDARALFSVAYGEIASSIYFALGVRRRLRARLHAARPARRRRCSS